MYRHAALYSSQLNPVKMRLNFARDVRRDVIREPDDSILEYLTDNSLLDTRIHDDRYLLCLLLFVVSDLEQQR